MTPSLATETIQQFKIQAHQPLVLNHPQAMWQIVSGSLAVFATPMADGQPVGARRYLFTVDTGDALFGVEEQCQPSGSKAAFGGLMAVPLEPTEIVYRPLSLEEGADPDLNTLKQLVDDWLQRFNQVEGWPQFPKAVKTDAIVPDIHYLSLLPGQSCRPDHHQVLWIRMQQGQAQWMGDAQFSMTSELGCFPVGDRAFFQAEDDIEFYARNTFEVKNRKILIKGVAQFHRYFLQQLIQLEAKATEVERRRFEARQELDQQATQTTVQDLAAVLQADDLPFRAEDGPLLMAAGAVGRAMGVTIEPPARSENLERLKEPLEAIARASQLRLRRVLLRGQWWTQDGGPILAYTRGDRHPVALLPVSAKAYELFDPKAVGNNGDRPPRVPIDLAIAQTLDPLAFVFYPPLPPGKLNVLTLLGFAFRGRQKDMLAILATGVAATVMGMVVPQATAVLIDEAVPYGNASLLVQIGIGLLAAAFGQTAFQLAQAIASMRIETASDATLQAAVWDRLLQLRTAFFRDYSIGDLNSRVSAISAIRRRLSGNTLQSIFVGLFSLLNLGLLFYYSASLAVLALIVALIVITVTTVTGVLLIRTHRPLMQLEGEINGLLVQLINGVPKLRVAGAETRAFAHWGHKYSQQLRLVRSTQRLEDGVSVFNTLMPTLTTVALFWLASTLIGDGNSGFTAGMFIAFSVAYGTFIGGATSLSLTLLEVLDVIPLWQRSRPILIAEPEVTRDKADPGRLTGHIKVEQVSFRYRDDGPLILNQVSIEAKPGEFIALVGPSGSGKSTVFRLLLGFETPITGSVYFDGQDLAGLDVSAVRRQLGVVLQNGRISAGSIFENIAGGALISLEDAWIAAERSGLADDLKAMPMKLHTVISEGGGNLSGGQRQRLIIARALALKPRILLLDEATSALDNRTQAIVSKSLDELQVTRLVVAHRLSTIRNADRIYVLENGHVVQQGNFETLAAEPGLFAKLIARQMA
ncbi:MAG: NHLP bacteriocin export ABC transporter permease/ATPase subunit [Cyanobacteria bacterium P01_A01_bin.123]